MTAGTKPQIRIADTQFAHGTSLGSGDLKIYPTHFDWYRGNENINDIIIITESCFHLVDTYTEKIKIALIIEPVSINPESYAWIKENDYKFKYILTHNRELLRRSSKYQFYFFGGCWIEPEDRKIYEKGFNFSIIASEKRVTEGHNLRHEVIEKCRDMINGIYGRGYHKIESKLMALKGARYHIVIENEKSDFWITEKLIDAFVTGCVPIYWGCPSVGKFFNIDGILCFNDALQLQLSMENFRLLKKDDYYSDKMQAAIKDNFERAKQYCIPEDYMWNTFLKTVFTYPDLVNKIQPTTQKLNQ